MQRHEIRQLLTAIDAAVASALLQACAADYDLDAAVREVSDE